MDEIPMANPMIAEVGPRSFAPQGSLKARTALVFVLLCARNPELRVEAVSLVADAVRTIASASRPAGGRGQPNICEP
jgi:hypothetical protein